MLIHSVTPIDYLMYPPNLPQFEMKAYDMGYIEGYKKENEFIVTRIISTDPKAYLDKKLFPGAVCKI